MMVLKDDNSNNRIDILGITTDDLYVLKLGLKCLIKDNAEVNKNRVYELMKGLNDELKFFETNSDSFPVYDKHKESGHSFVDLGLPSGLLWATCNVGASSPEQAGLYFAWGETEGFTAGQIARGERKFFKKTYKAKKIKAELTLEQDAAHVNMGGKWRMPTIEQLKELKEECSHEWTTLGGVKGVKVTGPNGNSIFLPAAGHYKGGYECEVGTDGGYWTASWSSVYNAWYMDIWDVGIAINCFYERYRGFPVRGVCER